MNHYIISIIGLKMFTQSFASEPISNFRHFLTVYFKFTIFEVSYMYFTNIDVIRCEDCAALTGS